MIAPAHQWAIQIDCTNVCNRACSNCTRLVGHGKPFFMPPEQFARAVEALRDFPLRSPPAEVSPLKLVGILGGEPLLHPQFRELVEILSAAVPRRHRGLWTSLDWEASEYGSLIRDAFPAVGIHNNRHDLQESLHSPVLVALQDVVSDPEVRQAVIDDCWLQQRWSGSITPKGFFFCEVAGALDWVFGGPGGLPVEPGCWERPLGDFREQVARWCPQCGIPLKLKGRPATEERDDVSETNWRALEAIGSRRLRKCVPYSPVEHDKESQPWLYRCASSR